jgi:uncharacterized protein
MSHHTGTYTIRYAGLPEGSHIFDFEVNRDFFLNYYKETEMQEVQILVHIEAERTEAALVLNMSITGNVVVECDRCLDPCNIGLETQQTLIFSSAGEHYFDRKDDDSLFEIAEETDHVVLDSILYDVILLAMPLRRVHDELDSEDSACNYEMLQRISEINEKKADDPRWDKLNEIKFDN